MVGVVILYGILLLIICLFILSFRKKLQTILRIVLLSASVILFYLFFGVPLLLYSPVQCYLGVYPAGEGSGIHSFYRNVLTGSIKEIDSECIPYGWMFVGNRLYDLPVSTQDRYLPINNDETKPNLQACGFALALPDGYTLQQPMNSFYGYSENERVCKVILGPNYTMGYEGFTGEQLQINVSLLTVPTKNIITKRSKRDGYGGKDESMTVEKGSNKYTIYWRNQPTIIDSVAESFIKQLP